MGSEPGESDSGTPVRRIRMTWSTWKQVRAKKESDELRENSLRSKHIPEIPDPTWESVAQQLGVEAEDLRYISGNSPVRLGRLAKLVFQDDAPPTGASHPSTSRKADMTEIPYPEVNVIPRTECPKVQAAQEIPQHWKKSSFRLAEIITNRMKRRQVQSFLEKVAKDMQEVRKLIAQGKDPSKQWRRKVHRPVIVEAKNCAQFAVGYTWDCRDPERCVLADIADKPVSTLNYDYLLKRCGEEYQEIYGESFPDQQLLYSLKFGCALESDFPWGIVLCPPHVSAYQYFDRVSEAVEEEKRTDWLMSSRELPCIPYHAAAFGAVLKKNRYPPDPRRTTDMSYPEGAAPNEFIAYEERFPKLKLLRIREVAQAAAIQDNAYEFVASLEPEMAEDLRPTAVAEDLKSYFNMFVMKRADRCLQGMVWSSAPHDYEFLTSRVLQFGSRVGPSYGQRTGNLLDALFEIDMDRWEREVRLEAESPSSRLTARKLWPESLRAWSDRRAGDMGVIQGRPFFGKQYIDDKIVVGLGKLRAIKALLLFWDLVEKAGFPVAEGKACFGESIDFLGLRLFLRQGVVRLNARKKRLYDEWLERVVETEYVEEEELESLLCTISFGAMAAPGVALRLRRPFRELTRARRRKGSMGKSGRQMGLKLSREVRSDFVAIRELFQKSTGGRFAEGPVIQGCASNMGATDASRAEGSFSGMGGICHKSGRFWWYQFSEEQIRRLPVHVTEFVAELVQMRLSGVHWDDGYNELVDNMAVVTSIELRSPKDVRLIEMLLLRDSLREELGVTTSTTYIRSEDNVLADLLSRGKFAEFRIHARNLGLTGIRGSDLRVTKEIPDLEMLFERLMELSDI